MTTQTQSPVAQDSGYRHAMGQLLVLYTQVDRLIMEICAERIASAPDELAKIALAKQTGDESRHVGIQQQWIKQFGIKPEPVINAENEATIRAHFRDLNWLDFLADLYLGVEALGSEAVEQIVPLADPGTKESLRIPLSDELDHIAFGVSRLREELDKLPDLEREKFLEKLPQRIDALTKAFHDFGIDIPRLFSEVGADYDALRNAVLARRSDLLEQIAA